MIITLVVVVLKIGHHDHRTSLPLVPDLTSTGFLRLHEKRSIRTQSKQKIRTTFGAARRMNDNDDLLKVHINLNF
jgi:hypothetical protein